MGPIARMGRVLCLLGVMLALAAQAEDGAGAQARAWTFASTPSWQDEFDGDGQPDPAKWGYDLGGKGWGNNELQYYTDKPANAFVADGLLTIVARRQRAGKNPYTSARLVSRGKGDFQYGRIEFRARLPVGRGTWAALWMLPTENRHGGWPRSGEIDIMEHVGYDPGQVHVTVHTQAYNHKIKTQRGKQAHVDSHSSEFHRYRVDWTPDWIRGYIDDAPVFEFANEGTGPDSWPFDQPFHLLMNLAVGGDWGGAQGVDESAFPAWMEVDYVRVYPLLQD
ncbi:glycoside hydrolase family 16 protein [Pseudoxanthomonas daejeonensis]|uniref:Glycoside hydrolase n=1 Tax=Pseudoxanthomonas daejeonensis TaxID=266062 RepID=A0ABQ6Z9P3_9GAMM|nr:glycoside hydrolase family 16 protein [Pseudoxanthomonas daejeonensis]KAF1696377.1 glycoside hydrolase [Pseudoxanthomonas daejeonensis]